MRLSSVLDHSFFRYAAVGAINTAVGLSAVLLLFYAFGFSYWFATFFGNCFGAVISYVLNRNFTFRSHVSGIRSLIRFAIVVMACYAVSYGAALHSGILLVALINDYAGKYAHSLAIFTGSALYTLLSYFGHRHFTFGSKQGGSSYESVPV